MVDMSSSSACHDGHLALPMPPLQDFLHGWPCDGTRRARQYRLTC